MSEEFICKICGMRVKNATSLGLHIRHSHKAITSREYYDKYLKTETEGVCKICGKETGYRGLSYGYPSYCSAKCSTGDPENIEKVKKTKKEKYGEDYTRIIAKKSVETKRLNPNAFKPSKRNTSVKNTKIEIALDYKELYTCKICGEEFDSYNTLFHISAHDMGVKQYFDKFVAPLLIENNGQCKYCGKPTNFHSFKTGYRKFCSSKCANLDPDIKEKIRARSIEKYGTEHPKQSEIVKERCREKSIEKYGTEHWLKSEEGKNRYKEKMRERFGVTNVSNIPGTEEKRLETMMKKYGMRYVKTQDYKEKYKATCIERYGETHPTKTKKVQEKIQNTHLDRYGVKHPYQNSSLLKEKFYNKTYDKIVSDGRLLNISPLFTKEEFNGVYSDYNFICDSCNTTFSHTLAGMKSLRCPTCKNHSLIEEKVYNFIRELDDSLEIIRNDKKVLNGREIDILVPELNIGIECNGTYWHSESAGGKDKHYHVGKTIEAAKNGVQLLHFFEDEIENQFDTVKSVIKSRLGSFDETVNIDDCEIILDNQHIENCKYLHEIHTPGTIPNTFIKIYYNGEIYGIVGINKKDTDSEVLFINTRLNSNILNLENKILEFIHDNVSEEFKIKVDLRFDNGDKISNNPHCSFVEFGDPNFYYLNSSTDRILNYINEESANTLDKIWDCGYMIFQYKSGENSSGQ